MSALHLDPLQLAPTTQSRTAHLQSPKWLVSFLVQIVIFLSVLIVIALLGIRGSHAQTCTISITATNFGAIDVLANSNTDSTGIITGSCAGLVAPTRVKICIGFDNGTYPLSGGFRQMGSGANRLLFNTYRNAAHTTVLTAAANAIRFNLTANSPTKTRTMYGRVPNGQQVVPIGNYSTVVNATARVARHVGGGTAPGCNAMPVWQIIPISFTAMVVPTCSVTVTNMDFGTTTLFTSNIDATSTVNVTCSNGAPYNIRLNGGTSGATNPTLRKMSLGVNQVTYGLYRNAARTLGWGATDGVNTKAGTGSAGVDPHTVYGRIPPQTSVAPGTYADTVIAVVSY